MPGERFTAYLSEEERAALRALASAEECSDNFVLRIALRALLFDKPIPTWLREAARNISNTTNGGARK